MQHIPVLGQGTVFESDNVAAIQAEGFPVPEKRPWAMT